jgi:hypothetical protein
LLPSSEFGAIGKPCVNIKTETVGINTKTMDIPIRAMTALKRQKEDKRRNTVAKERLDCVFLGAVTHLNEAKEKSGRQLPFGKMSKVMQGL